MVSNAHKVPVEIIPRLADCNAHVLTHQAVLTFSYFLDIFSSLYSVSPNACLKCALMSQRCPFSLSCLPFWACVLVSNPSAGPEVGSVHSRELVPHTAA